MTNGWIISIIFLAVIIALIVMVAVRSRKEKRRERETALLKEKEEECRQKIYKKLSAMEEKPLSDKDRKRFSEIKEHACNLVDEGLGLDFLEDLLNVLSSIDFDS